jgi:hypothetical protein
VNRRDFLSATLLLPTLARQTSELRLIGEVPLVAPGVSAPPFGRLLGDGLDARLFTDLSAVRPQPPTPTDQFFVRTAAPAALPTAWSLTLAGLVQAPASLTLRDLEPLISTSGRYLMECSGNSDPSNFGLISTADWEGVALTALLDRVKPSSGASRVMVSGVDDMSATPRTSVPGASWIFSRDELQRAMLAVRMNGAPLPRDHVPLIRPRSSPAARLQLHQGWTHRVVARRGATTQMQEFAARTHQNIGQRRTRRWRDPAVIDTAAMPVRVENADHARIAGIIWGGSKPTNALSIRFKTSEPWVRVDDCAMPASTLTWSLWSHTWRPSAPGRYQIVLRVDDPAIRTRRLDLFFYVRELQIDEV